MYEISDYLRHKIKLSTGILRCPNGRYTLVGSIPIELTHEYESGFTTGRKSNMYDTEAEAIKALLELGITHFQLANCQWYDKK
jgi:hypothetical protein